MNKHYDFLLILGLSLLFSLASGFHQALYFGLVLVLLVWFGVRDTARKIALKEDLTGGAGFAGTELFLKVQLYNPSWFPVFWCQVSRAFSAELGANFSQTLVSLRPYGKADIQMMLYPERRGVYHVPDLKLALGDPFGWKEHNLSIASPEKIIVYPPLFPITGMNLTRHLPWGQTRLLFGMHEDPARLRGCRDYHPGDSLKRIHWPNLARTGVLKVKEWETTLTSTIGIFLNLAEADYPVSDWFRLSESGIEFAAALVHLFTSSHETLGFYCNGQLAGVPPETIFKFTAKHGYTQGKQILTFLAGVALQDSQPYSALFRDAYRLGNGSSLIFITPRISVELAQRAHSLQQAGYHPLFLWLESSGSVTPPAVPEQAGIPCFTVTKRRDSNEFLITKTR